jgi:hypothetical protein
MLRGERVGDTASPETRPGDASAAEGRSRDARTTDPRTAESAAPVSLDPPLPGA